MTATDQRAASSFENIDSPQYILTLLERLVVEATLIEVESVADGGSSFLSTVLAVDGAKRLMLLDLPYSQLGYLSSNSPDMRVSVTAVLSGAMIQFSVPVGQLILEEGMPHYRTPFPETIYYQQQRNAHRVSLMQLAVSVRIDTQDGLNFEARLYDLSEGGMRVMVTPKVAQRLRESSLVNVIIDAQPYSSEPIVAELSHSFDKVEETGTTIGFQFLSPNARQRQRISHQVRGLERRLMRGGDYSY